MAIMRACKALDHRFDSEYRLINPGYGEASYRLRVAKSAWRCLATPATPAFPCVASSANEAESTCLAWQSVLLVPFMRKPGYAFVAYFCQLRRLCCPLAKLGSPFAMAERYFAITRLRQRTKRAIETTTRSNDELQSPTYRLAKTTKTSKVDRALHH